MIKKILLLITISFFFVSCGSAQKTAYKKPSKLKKTKQVTQKEVTIADKIIWSAVSYKGTPYKYAGITKKGMDCSGLVFTSFKERNIIMPRSSSMLYKEGHKISLNTAKRGDLLFFKTTKKTRSKINHVAIVTSVKNGVVHFIHATSSKGVIESNMLQKYWKNSFVQAKRVL